MNRKLYYLTCGLLAIVTMLLVFNPLSTVAQTAKTEINLVAGNEAGEYYSIAKNIEELARQKELDVDVIPSRGALQNIHDVFNYQSVPLGITQGDVLAFLNTFANDDEEARLQAESLRVVLPLYQEQIHLITRKNINSVEELAGKKVSIGEEGSGTSTTTATLLFQWGIKPERMFTYDVRRAISALRNQEIDAMFYVVGVPAKVLQEQILPEDEFQILPISLAMNSEDDFFPRLYSAVQLPANTYDWQSNPVETLAVQSYLITTENQDCKSVTPIAQLIKDNLAWLKQNGDSVWNNVNLDIVDGQTQRLSQCSK